MENSTKLNEALEYLKSVEVEFQHDRIKYDVFTEVLKDYKAGKIDIEGMKVRVKGLFKEHTNLISRFNAFLPKEHQITPRLELEDGLAFYKAVKDAFQDKRENLDEFLNLMMDWKYERVDIRSFVARIKELLKEHTDLILGFNLFLPFQLDVPEMTCNQFKGDASRVHCSNNSEYYAAVSECKDDFKKEGRKRSKRRDFSSIIEYILESKNREGVVGGYNEGCEKLTPMKRRTSNTSHRVEFEIVDKVNSDADETSSSNEGSKKKITKREAKNERSNNPSKKRKIDYNNNNDNDNINDQLQEGRPEVPFEFKEKIDMMEGSDVMLVMQKELTKSDVTENNGPLSISEKQVINENFLEPNEKSSLDYDREEGRKKRIGMSVSVLDPSLNLYDGMCFKKWRMVKSEIYNITGKWNNLVAKNQMEEGQKVQLWSFRSDGQLCFALVKL